MTPPLTWAEHRARILAVPVVEQERPVEMDVDDDTEEIAETFTRYGNFDGAAYDAACEHIEAVEDRGAYMAEQRAQCVTITAAERRRKDAELAGQVPLAVVDRAFVVPFQCNGTPENARQRARERQARDNDAYREREAKRKADVRAKARRREVEALEGAGQRRLVG